jgi:hypothetical protein
MGQSFGIRIKKARADEQRGKSARKEDVTTMTSPTVSQPSRRRATSPVDLLRAKVNYTKDSQIMRLCEPDFPSHHLPQSRRAG